MVLPNKNSEKAISIYSQHLIDNIKKTGLNIKGVDYIAGSPISAFKILPKLLKYDIIHIQHEYNLFGGFGLPFFVLFFFLRIFKKGLLVITMHTILSQKEKFKSTKIKTFLRKILYRLQNRLINWASDIIIVHENFSKEILTKEYGVSKENIRVLPQGIIENITFTNKQKAKKELNLSGPVYLMIGNLTYDNGSDIILKQAGKIEKNILFVTNPNAVNTRNKKEILDWINFNKTIVKKNNFQKFVRFDLKEIPDTLWWKYFSAADLILLPYRGGIRSGIFSDAIAAKKPMIGSNINFFREYAKKYGFIRIAKKEEDFPKEINEAMKISNYKKMRSAFERYIKEYGFSSLARKYKKLYSSLK